MTFVLPSDADPAPVPPTSVPSSPPDFLAQLSAAQKADARGRELTDSEFTGSPSASGTALRPGQSLSQMSDADLKAIATQGPAGASGGWSNAPLAPVTSRNFADVDRAFASGPDLSSVSDEALRKIAGSSGTAALRNGAATPAGPSEVTYDQFFGSPGGPSGPHLLSDADVGLTGVAGRPKFVLPSDELTDEQFLGTPAPVGPDVAKSAGFGLVSGVEGLAGLPGYIERGAKSLMNQATAIPDYGMLWAQGKAAEAAGLLPKGQTASDWAAAKLDQLNATRSGVDAMPSPADIHGAAAAIGVPDYQPQTTAGKYAYTIGSFLPGALATPAGGPLGVLGNAIKFGVIPGAASEAAGEATAGTGIEPWARFIAGTGAGVGSDLAATSIGAAARAGKNFESPKLR